MVMKYLASKFTKYHFKRIQVNVTFVKEADCYPALKVEDYNILDRNILPKHIQLNSKHYLEIRYLKNILDTLSPSKLYSFNEFEV
jgi:hypothetical protein